ncbi:hypothetical protein Q3G72_029026 [Acer saccharum]|nr:hypothetical protein Q3G72_029026 [Acer saccharum]
MDFAVTHIYREEIHKSSTPVSTKDGLLAEIHKRPNGSSKIGLKSGKWKRLARDGVRMDSGLEAEVQMGKRGLVLENDSEKQEVKFAKTQALLPSSGLVHKRCFHFKECWVNSNGCIDIVKDAGGTVSGN